MKATIQMWKLGGDTKPSWHDFGCATTEIGLKRVLAKAIEDSERYGKLRHPDGGPDYGALRVQYEDGTLDYDIDVLMI